MYVQTDYFSNRAYVTASELMPQCVAGRGEAGSDPLRACFGSYVERRTNQNLPRNTFRCAAGRGVALARASASGGMGGRQDVHGSSALCNAGQAKAVPLLEQRIS